MQTLDTWDATSLTHSPKYDAHYVNEDRQEIMEEDLGEDPDKPKKNVCSKVLKRNRTNWNEVKTKR